MHILNAASLWGVCIFSTQISKTCKFGLMVTLNCPYVCMWAFLNHLFFSFLFSSNIVWRAKSHSLLNAHVSLSMCDLYYCLKYSTCFEFCRKSLAVFSADWLTCSRWTLITTMRDLRLDFETQGQRLETWLGLELKDLGPYLVVTLNKS